MKIAVVGAGIVGITTAYELARDGHEVTVLERRGAAAEEASFANAGVIAPGYVTPWAAPGMPWKVLRQMLGTHSAFRVQLPLSAHELTWLWQFWRACRSDVYVKHRIALQQLAFYSRSQLHNIIERHSFELDRSDGYLVALRGDKELSAVQPSLAMLRDLGVSVTQLDEAATRSIEPAINTDTHFAGALHLKDDEVANCRQFALLLKDECRRMGVRFEFNMAVQSLSFSDAGASNCVTLTASAPTQNSQFSSSIGHELKATPASTQTHDAVVLCTGAQSLTLLRPHGIQLPLASVYGYSVSAHIKESLNAPRSGLMDERYKVSITRLGQRVRVAGSAQVGGNAGKLHPGAMQTLYKVLQDWFPGAAVMSQGIQQWQGARPMLANRPPVIGASSQRGLWLNLGHGSSGWALACGSARLLADTMSSRNAPLDVNPFKLAPTV